MKDYIIPLFIIMFFSNIQAQDDVFVKVEKSDSITATNFIVGNNWYMHTSSSDLKSILSHCSSTSGNPMLSSFVVLQNNPILELSAGSRNRIKDSVLTKIVLDTLIRQYDLQYIMSDTDSIEIINVISVSQKVRQTPNSGTNFSTEGFLTLDNAEFYDFSKMFQQRGLILKTKNINIAQRRMTFLIPNNLLKVMPENKNELLRLLDESGIHAEIIKEPVVYLTNAPEKIK